MSVNKVFVDTNIFVALEDKKDKTHTKASKLLDKLEKIGVQLYTSSDVIGESLTVISKKLDKRAAEVFYKNYLSGYMLEIFIDESMHIEARNLFLKTRSKNVSFIDCSSVVVMKKEDIKAAFTFDKHFRSLGVKLLSDVL